MSTGTIVSGKGEISGKVNGDELRALPIVIEEALGDKINIEDYTPSHIAHGKGYALIMRASNGKGYIIYDSAVPAEERDVDKMRSERGILAARIGVIPVASSKYEISNVQLFSFRRRH